MYCIFLLLFDRCFYIIYQTIYLSVNIHKLNSLFSWENSLLVQNAEVYMVLVKTSNCMRKFYSLQGLFITAELFTARNEVGAR